MLACLLACLVVCLLHVFNFGWLRACFYYYVWFEFVSHTGQHDRDCLAIALGIFGDNRLKRKIAYEYGVGRNLTPGRALKMMATPGDNFVRISDRPSNEQIKEQRKTMQGKKHYSSACIEALHLFLKHPPPNVKILPGVECTEA